MKDMLLNAANPEILREKMAENESIMKEMSLTWEEKLRKTGNHSISDQLAVFRPAQGGPKTSNGENGSSCGIWGNKGEQKTHKG